MLSIVVPCYNEAGNIPHLFARVVTLFGEQVELEVILVNNGSTDDSSVLFKEQLAQHSQFNIKVVEVPKNQGYGYGILFGLACATGEYLGWTHADLQTDIADCLRAYQRLITGAPDLVLVKGFRKKRNIVDKVFSFGMSVFAYPVLGMWLSEINAQPKIFKREFYQKIKEKAPFDFSLDLYWMIRAKEMGQIATIPVYFTQRLYGEAKGGGGSLKLKYKLMKRTTSYILQTRSTLR